MHRTIVLAISTVALTAAGSAFADSPKLKGAYGFTGTAACLVAPGHITTDTTNPNPGTPLPNSGFKPNLQPNDATPGGTQSSFARSFSVEGIRTFDGHGNGTVKGTVVGIVTRPTPGPNGYPNFPPSASGGDFSFSFTYTVNPDGSWDSAMVPGSYSEIFTAGPRTGQTAIVDAIPPVHGMVSQDGKTLIAAHLDPVVETHVFSNGDAYPEICHRSRVFIKLQDTDDDDRGRGRD